MTSLQKKKEEDALNQTSKFTKRDDAELKGLEKRFSNPEKWNNSLHPIHFKKKT